MAKIIKKIMSREFPWNENAYKAEDVIKTTLGFSDTYSTFCRAGQDL